MSNAITSHGTLIYINGTAIAEQKDITPPQRVRNRFDASNQNDNDSSVVISGLRRKGDLKLKINYLPSGEATHGSTGSGLLALYNAGTKCLFKGLRPDGSYWSASGWVAEFQESDPVDGILEADVTVALTGAFTDTP